MPKGYGIHAGAKGLFAWSDVTAQLEKSKNYWIGSTRPDGRPHVMPVWGVWLDGAVCFGTDRTSRKARNLQANPAATVNLESGDEAVIIEGTVREISDAKEIAAIDAAYVKKYKMKLTDAPGIPYIVAIEPRVAFAWHERNFPESATRWRLPQR
jgi:nitroimidazol reductase NimA-like FMN-containing flavoprotein (pyridoxamine 5'-phosphate oxidase superfamily)